MSIKTTLCKIGQIKRIVVMKKALLFIFTIFILIGCQKDDVIDPEQEQIQRKKEFKELLVLCNDQKKASACKEIARGFQDKKYIVINKNTYDMIEKYYKKACSYGDRGSCPAPTLF